MSGVQHRFGKKEVLPRDFLNKMSPTERGDSPAEGKIPRKVIF